MLDNVRRAFGELSRLSRELIIFAIALVLGLVLVPLAIWTVGNRILGPYPHGTNPHAGPMALLGDFFYGLSQGWLTFWIVALGPVVLISFVRAVLAWLRHEPATSPPAPPGR